MEHEVTFARWIGKLLGIVFFYLFLLIGTSLLVFAIYTVLASLLGMEEGWEKHLLEAVGLATIGAAICELGGVFRGTLPRALGLTKESSEEEVHTDIVTFLRVVVIAVSVEGLILIFKSVGDGSNGNFLSAAVMMGSAALLLMGIGLFHRLTRQK